jgi:hypothetical protein
MSGGGGNVDMGGASHDTCSVAACGGASDGDDTVDGGRRRPWNAEDMAVYFDRMLDYAAGEAATTTQVFSGRKKRTDSHRHMNERAREHILFVSSSTFSSFFFSSFFFLFFDSDVSLIDGQEQEQEEEEAAAAAAPAITMSTQNPNNNSSAASSSVSDASGGDSDAGGDVGGGEWRVEQQRLSWDVLDAFGASAASNHAVPPRKAFNSSDQPGSGYFQVLG